MTISYKKLWKLLIDKDLMKKDLQQDAWISWATITKMSKGETVSLDVLMKVCNMLHCDIGDIVEFIDEEIPSYMGLHGIGHR
mgnify:CR=1 FL=1